MFRAALLADQTWTHSVLTFLLFVFSFLFFFVQASSRAMAAPGSGATVHDVVVVRHLLINTALLLQMCEEKNSNARLWFFSQITNASLCSCKILPLIATSVGLFFFFFSSSPWSGPQWFLSHSPWLFLPSPFCAPPNKTQPTYTVCTLICHASTVLWTHPHVQSRVWQTRLNI